MTKEYDYFVEGEFSFLMRSTSPSNLSSSLASIIKKAGFDDRNFEIRVSRVADTGKEKKSEPKIVDDDELKVKKPVKANKEVKTKNANKPSRQKRGTKTPSSKRRDKSNRKV